MARLIRHPWWTISDKYRSKRGDFLRFENMIKKLFEGAGFDVVDSDGVADIGDYIVRRVELGRERGYAVELMLNLSGKTAVEYSNLFRRHVRAQKMPFPTFDEFWVITVSLPTDIERVRAQIDRHFRILDLRELRAILYPPASRRSKQIGGGKGRTKIGKAIFANEKQIGLAVASLTLLVDEKIEMLRSQLLNSDESIAQRDASIAKYANLKADLEAITTAIAQFNKGDAKEPKVVKSVTTFVEGVRNWWNKDHEKICAKTYDMGMFATAVGICSLAGAGGPMSVAVSAALVGGKPVADAMKGLAKKFLSA